MPEWTNVSRKPAGLSLRLSAQPIRAAATLELESCSICLVKTERSHNTPTNSGSGCGPSPSLDRRGTF